MEPTDKEIECAKKIAYYFPPACETTATAMVSMQRIQTIAKELVIYREQLVKKYDKVLDEAEDSLTHLIDVGMEYYDMECGENGSKAIETAQTTISNIRELRGKHDS